MARDRPSVPLDRLQKAASKLRPNEREVLILSAREDLSNAEIAADLYLGETTVKTHLGRVLDKLGLRDRARAIAWAHRSGLLEDDGTTPP